ncbi:MAG TPA: hypothetical protein VK913_07765, partial [Erythrobacter sp.]|nr:hypothetical protein [Erythrobacter sp.]
MRLPLRTFIRFGVALPVFGLATMANAQNYSDLPPLTPMSEAEVRSLPVEYRTAPMAVQSDETVTMVNRVETITRTRRIDIPRAPLPAAQQGYPAQGYAHHGYAAPAVF